MLVRCLRRRDLAGALPRLALGVVSERASTGSGAGGGFGSRGLAGLGLRVTQDSSFLCSRAKVLR